MAARQGIRIKAGRNKNAKYKLSYRKYSYRKTLNNETKYKYTYRKRIYGKSNKYSYRYG